MIYNKGLQYWLFDKATEYCVWYIRKHPEYYFVFKLILKDELTARHITLKEYEGKSL